MREDVEYLSHSLLGGRGFGSTGAVEASWFALRRFEAAGLQTSIRCFSTPKGVGHTIVGLHQGNPRSDSYVLVMAYFDGLGSLGGETLPGADANASGVAMLLSLADSLATSRGNYIFAALDGHNADRAGAADLCALPYKLSMVVNLDIIGSSLAPQNKLRPDYLIVLGGEPYEKQLEHLNIGINMRLYFDYYRSKSFTDYFYRKVSDQTPFLERGCKAVMFTSGITMNTNKPSDTFDTLDYEVMEKRRTLILSWLKSF